MSGQQRSSRSTRRPSRASKYHQQYLSFLRKWKSYVHSSQYTECERLCLDHIDRIDRSIRFQIKQYGQRHGGAHIDSSDGRFSDIKNYRSKVRNLYAVLLHDYLKQHSDALEQYELCVEDDEFNASAHYNWAILYKNFYKDYESAEIHYRKAIELKPNHAAYHNNYGLLLEQQLKKYDAAKKQFGIALSLDDKNGRAHTNMANLLKKHYKDYQTAKIHYEKAINLDPQNPTRHFNYALFLKHNLNDYTSAANEYEKAINLDNNYYQAHNEYKNFLLTESPFHRKNNGNKKEQKEHGNRCIKYALILLWNKKIKDAKEIITMAIKCQAKNVFAKLINEPYNSIDNLSVNNNNNEQLYYQQLVSQKENELYNLHSKMDRFHRRLSNITSSLKKCQNNAGGILPTITTQQSMDSIQDNDKNTPTGSVASLPAQPPPVITPFSPQGYSDYNHEKRNSGASSLLSQSQSHSQNTTVVNNPRPGNLYREASGSQWGMGQLENLTSEMGQEIQRLNMLAQRGYALSDEEEQNETDNDNDEIHYNGNQYNNYNPENNNKSNKAAKLQPNATYFSPNPTTFPNQPQKSAQFTTGKRNSLISVNSASDFHQKYMDIHKQTLFSAAKIIENVMNESCDDGGMIDEYRKKLDDVMHMIVQTVRVWDYIDADHDNINTNNVGRLTQNNIMNHNNNKGDDVILLTPDDAIFETARTLGGMSMVSQTSSAAMAQRKNFLYKASNNPNVRKGDRVVAKHLAQTYLTTRCDTPKSVLSASQLPFFSDEDEESTVYEHEEQVLGVKNKYKKKEVYGTTEIRCEQRVKRWKQQNKLQEHLNKINEWDFDVFYVVETAGNYAMPAIALTLLEYRGLIDEFGLNTTHLCNYFHQISLEYKNNPYHTNIHGCDVLVSCNYFLNAKLMRNIRGIDQFACLVAGATHDVGHPGNNNGFEIAKESDLAVTYNDISVLESYHIALAWQILKRPGCNILTSLDKTQRKEFRKLFIDSILGTDMSRHAEQQKLLAELIDCVTNSGIDLDHLDHNNDFVTGVPEDDNKSMVSISNIPPNSIYADAAKFAKVVIPLMVHTADLSNPAKDIKLYGEWAKRVVSEFFTQAENEKKLKIPVSAFMDSAQTDLPTIQCGFVNHVIRPWFDLWGRLLRDKKQGPTFQFNVNENLKFMQNELDKLKQKKKEKKKAELDGFNKVKQRHQVKEDGGSEGTLSVMDMTFEDINKVEMRDRMQRMEELKTKQKEYYINEQHHHQQQQQVPVQVVQVSDGVDDFEYDGDNINQQQVQVLPPMRKKKMLYSGYDNSNYSEQNGHKNKKNKKGKKIRNSKQRKNSRELTTIAEV